LLVGAGQVRDDDEIPLVQPASAGRRGALPVLILARDERKEAELLAERIAQAHATGTPLQDMAVLCRHRGLMEPICRSLKKREVPVESMSAMSVRDFNWVQPSVKLLTLHIAKGLKLLRVFVAGLQALPLRDESLEDAARLLYVAMTRATRELVLSAHGTSPMVERVQTSLESVTRRFSGT
jgi:superfamily I DNA/RNA helicase